MRFTNSCLKNSRSCNLANGQQAQPECVRCIFKVVFFSCQPNNLNISRAAIKTDGYLSGFNNDGDLALAVGMLQHRAELVAIRYNVHIIHFLVLFGIRFTSCPRVGSGIFSENQYFFRHGASEVKDRQ